jgi:hypothetical protein
MFYGNLILFLLFLAFWTSMAWAAITHVKTLQRIAVTLERIAQQTEDRFIH